MKLGTFNTTIKGISPILMHSSKGMRPRGTIGGEPAEGSGGASKPEAPPSVEEEAEAGAYRLADGRLFVPGGAVREALITACKGYEVQVAGKKRKQPLWQVMAATVFLPQPEIVLYRDGEPITTYEIDLRRVVVARSGVVRARPMIPLPWEIEVVVEYDAGQWASTDLIVEMLNNAGRYPGLLEFRPEKGGTFGRFEAAAVNGKKPK